ncbi:MAG: DUF4382 domain-containing protein [Thaumarchaeota archaeon]|nr:MAG: DUF4382 domain-containing protein [Nitrososphaerota archaeon]
MSTKKNIMLSGAAALVVAASILAVAIFSGVSLLPNANTTKTTTHTIGATTSSRAPGTLSVLLTDPPHVPLGVTKVYIAYSNLAVHVSEAGNQSGWTLLKSDGSIELLGTVNVSQTISSVKIAAGEYNLLRFNISSAQVTYNGKNYTAFVPRSALIVPIVGGIEVNASKPSATIINIQPTVYNIGSASNPEFMIRHWAKAFPVPSSQVTEEEEHEGHRLSLIGKAWWTDVLERYTSNALITSATLTPTSLSLTVKDTGSQSTKLRLVVVSPLATPLIGAEHDRPPAVLFGSAIFIVLPNATLLPIQKYVLAAHQQGVGAEDVVTALASGGYNLTAGASATLSYKGTITLGFNLHIVQPLQGGQSIVPGQQYLVSVLGDEALASQVVVAGQ